MSRLMVILILLLLLGIAMFVAAFGWTVADSPELGDSGQLGLWLGTVAAALIVLILLFLIVGGRGGRRP
ncbi:hypothetical protein ACFOD4_15145 [Pseudoroseomonas globiformis]|uniref:DUF3309 domain-containing protein n=1 Tax=Teichococcus globiformis TaxID=2307229 RepID=A0ABV7G5E1_9PROT